MLGWGVFGWLAVEVLRPSLHYPALFILPSAGIALAGALLSAKLLGELMARFMPQDETYAISTDGLMGLTGKVVYPVSETAGRVHVFDQFRTLHVTPARVRPGAEGLTRGTEIIVASLPPDRHYVIVEPLGFTARESSVGQAR